MKALLIDLGELTHPNLPVALRAHSVTVEPTADLTHAVWLCRETAPAVALLCVDEPGVHESRVARRLRASGSRTPLLVVAQHADPDAVVAALDAGADDYVAPPVRLAEICARVRALGRREAVAVPPVLTAGTLRCDVGSGEVTRAGVPIELSPQQLAVLAELLRRSGQVVTRAELLDAVWDPATQATSNVVDQMIAVLRRKVDAPFGTRELQTVRGRGYRWVEPSAGASGGGRPPA